MAGKCAGKKREIDIRVIFFAADGSKDRFFMLIGWDVLRGKGWDKPLVKSAGRIAKACWLFIIFEADWVLSDFLIKLVETHCVLLFIVASTGNVAYTKLFLVTWLAEQATSTLAYFTKVVLKSRPGKALGLEMVLTVFLQERDVMAVNNWVISNMHHAC